MTAPGYRGHRMARSARLALRHAELRALRIFVSYDAEHLALFLADHS
jgi:hypothetical protein